MTIDLSAINLNLVFWLAILLVVILVIFGIIRFFFQHLLHLILRGCGFLFLLVVVLFILHLLKVF